MDIFSVILLALVLGIIFGGLVCIEFIVFLVFGKRWLNARVLSWVEAINIIIIPALFLLNDNDHMNCDTEDIAVFAPAHRITMYCLVLCCIASYYYSKYRKKAGGPVLEIIVNCFLLIGILLNGFIMYHVYYSQENDFALYCVPITLLFIIMLAHNHWMIVLHAAKTEAPNSKLAKACLYVLNMAPLQKFPILLIICLPLLVVMSALLLLFGQKPDSIVRMFTETYEHGFSTLDPANLPIHDDHFLCTIAAKGHPEFVKPARTGIRWGNRIMVNRQLLVSNAFEELLEHKTPRLHKYARKVYDVVGGNCAKLYEVLGNKWISDVVYVMMKPLEWLFLIVLYTFDANPENRIAKQYLSAEDRKKLQ